ncbi:MAG: hypothetical protein AAF376_20045, partial [Pseudomonadota bacterium]
SSSTGSFSTFAATTGLASATTVSVVDPSTLSGAAVVDFEDLGLAALDTINLDEEFESGTVQFSAGFVGQTITPSGSFDTLSGTPTGPLTLFNDDPDENILAVDGGDGNVGNTSIAGLGPLGFPAFDAIGEGVISLLFDFDQSEFGFDLIGGDGGGATLQFFSRDGMLLSEIATGTIFGTISLGFATDDGSQSIAGVSIVNSDPGGIGVDNILSDVVGVIGPPPTVPPVTPPVAPIPLPAGAWLLLSGLAVLGASTKLRS